MAKHPRKTPLLAVFGTNVRLGRVRAGMSQEELAAAIGTDQSFISKIERGTSAASLETVARIAAALDVHPGELMDENLGRPKREV